MKNFLPEQEVKLRELYQSGLNDYDVASIMHVGRDRLRLWRREHGINSKTNKKNLSPEICSEIIKRVRNGETFTSIAKSYGVCRTSITRLLNKHGFEYEVNKRSRPDWIADYKLNSKQEALLIGEMLGDGHIERTSESSAYYYCGHSREQESFVLWKFFEMRPISSRIYYGTSTSGDYISLNSWSIKDLKKYHDIFYPSGKGAKVLPLWIIEKVTPLSLAVWFMGDGSVSKKTSSFTVGKNVDILPIIEGLNRKYDNMFKASKYDFQWTITITKPEQFFRLIGCYIVPDMMYKVPEMFRCYCASSFAKEFIDFITSNKQRDVCKIEYNWDNCSGGFYVFKSESGLEKKIREPDIFALSEGNLINGVNFFAMTPSAFEKLSSEDKNKYIKAAFIYYRNKGFPYLRLSNEKLIKIGRSLSLYEPVVEKNIIKHCSMGINFCEHFFPHIYEARRYDKKAPMEIWRDDFSFRKFLKNRFLYSDKFNDSSIRRGLKILGSSVSNFKPTVAQYVYKNYLPPGGITYDFCAGYGGRLLGFLSSKRNSTYIGVDPLFKNCISLKNMYNFWSSFIDNSNKVRIISACAEDCFFGENFIDLCFSCPPYFDLERYSEDKSQSYFKYSKYDIWLENFWKNIVSKCFRMLKNTGYFIYVIGNYKKYDLIKDFQAICISEGFIKLQEIRVPLAHLFSKEGESFKYEFMMIYKK